MLFSVINYDFCLVKSYIFVGEFSYYDNNFIINLQDVDGLIQKKAYKVLSIILRVSPHANASELYSSFVSAFRCIF